MDDHYTPREREVAAFLELLGPIYRHADAAKCAQLETRVHDFARPGELLTGFHCRHPHYLEERPPDGFADVVALTCGALASYDMADLLIDAGTYQDPTVLIETLTLLEPQVQVFFDKLWEQCALDATVFAALGGVTRRVYDGLLRPRGSFMRFVAGEAPADSNKLPAYRRTRDAYLTTRVSNDATLDPAAWSLSWTLISGWAGTYDELRDVVTQLTRLPVLD